MGITQIAKKIGSLIMGQKIIYPISYSSMYSEAEINPSKLKEVWTISDKIKANKAKYEGVATQFNNGMEWWFVAVIHAMESGCKFTTHLHNGDPLTARTVQVPKGRPLGQPPFTWEESAIDALRLMRYDKMTDWSMEECLNRLEKYNGLGYKKRGIPSPYLWSYTQFYTKGKFVADGKFDPNAVSKQAGCVAILKALGV